MSNDNIIALADADAAPVRALADHLRMHPVNVVKDLKSRGYALGSIRGATGQWTKALARGDAERYLAERRSSLLPSAYGEGEDRRLDGTVADLQAVRRREELRARLSLSPRRRCGP
jgi:hypothetical protein